MLEGCHIVGSATETTDLPPEALHPVHPLPPPTRAQTLAAHKPINTKAYIAQGIIGNMWAGRLENTSTLLGPSCGGCTVNRCTLNLSHCLAPAAQWQCGGLPSSSAGLHGCQPPLHIPRQHTIPRVVNHPPTQ